MNIKEARTAIEAILASIPDRELPEFDRVELDDDSNRVTVWWSGKGHCLGTAKSGGERDPLVYRRSGSWDAIEAEMAYRADRRLLDNGDNPTGIKLGRRKVVR